MINTAAFDKYGRFLFCTTGSRNWIHVFDASPTLKQSWNTSTFCIDTEDNTLYYSENHGITKQPLLWSSFGKQEIGENLNLDNVNEISVGTNYIVAFTSKTISIDNYYSLVCIDKFDINKMLKKIEILSDIVSAGYNFTCDVMVVGDKAYVLQTYDDASTVVEWSKMQIYSLPDFKLLKTVTGFYGAMQFLGKRDGKLYIADKHVNSAIPKRLGIYDTLTGKLEFIPVSKFNSNILFEF